MSSPKLAAGRWLPWAGLLVLATFGAFAGVASNGFVNFDDPLYVTANPHVRAGLTLDSVNWAFTTWHSANWHPLTWLSHMLDVELFGLDAGAHHLMSVFLHTLSALLLFSFLQSVTGHPGRAFFVAALFAIHPLRVESVAWASERKDVLAVLFWMLCLHAYLAYTRRGGTGRYLLLVLAFVLGLLCKPMLVTLPCVLVLLDVWPLNRFTWRTAIVEKLPLLFLAGASSFFTTVVQAAGGAVTIDRIALPARLANAASAYVAYAVQSCWPSDLAAFYPHPALRDPGASAWDGISITSAVLLFAVTASLLFLARRRRWLATGWLWYLGTLVPVIGILQVGEQARADRYTYVTTIGLALICVWGVAEFGEKRPLIRRLSIALGTLALLFFGWRTRVEVRVWRGSESLWRHALEVTTGNRLAHSNLASILAENGEWPEAEEHYQLALDLDPQSPRANTGMGYVLHMLGRNDEALRFLYRAEKLDPSYSETPNNIGLVYGSRGQMDRAEDRFLQALELDPSNARALSNLGAVHLAQRRNDEAIAAFLEALQLQPELTSARVNLGIAYRSTQRLEEARLEFERVLSQLPKHGTAHAELGLMAFGRRDAKAAIAHLRVSLEVTFDVEVARALAQVLGTVGDERLRDGDAALRAIEAAREGGAGSDPRLLWIEAAAHAARGDFPAAIVAQEKAIERAPASLRDFEEERLQRYREGRPWIDTDWR